MNITLINITKSTNKEKKMMAKFIVNGRKRTIHFGAKDYFDYTLYYKQNKEIAEKKKMLLSKDIKSMKILIIP